MLLMLVIIVSLVSICKLETTYWAVCWVSGNLFYQRQSRQSRGMKTPLIFKGCFNLTLVLHGLLHLVFEQKAFHWSTFVSKSYLYFNFSQQLLHFTTSILSKVWCNIWWYIPKNSDLPETNRKLYAASRYILNSSDYSFLNMSSRS